MTTFPMYYKPTQVHMEDKSQNLILQLKCYNCQEDMLLQMIYHRHNISQLGILNIHRYSQDLWLENMCLLDMGLKGMMK